MPLTYVELFAGCGGMSLGLDAAGMDRLLSNELSPMAAQTYAYNLLGTDLEDPRFATLDVGERKVLWLQSRYPSGEVRQRLGENPQEFSSQPNRGELARGDLAGKLVVADIRELNRYVAEHGPLLGGRYPDIVSGGPPCQSFSLAGLREYGNRRNRLPWEFATFVHAHQPRLVVLENVSGIMRPFTEDGHKVYAWFEVAKAFAAKGYAPLCLHVNAARVGVAQNRPRFLMFGVRADQLDTALANLGDHSWVLDMGRDLLQAEGVAEYDPIRHQVLDLTKEQEPLDLTGSLLARYFNTVQEPYTVRDAIGDLSTPAGERSGYARGLSEQFAPSLVPAQQPSGLLANNEHRGHQPLVRARFRAYQVVEQLAAQGDKESARRLSDLVRGRADPHKVPQELLRDALRVPGFPLVNEEGSPIIEVSEARAVLQRLQTRKHTQRSLGPNRPAPAAVSIPDDASHYSEQRTLSVREMARIQSFPDEFVFRSRVTTGGQRRRFQVPQYTQVGNAVPPKLGLQIGRFAHHLLQAG